MMAVQKNWVSQKSAGTVVLQVLAAVLPPAWPKLPRGGITQESDHNYKRKLESLPKRHFMISCASLLEWQLPIHAMFRFFFVVAVSVCNGSLQMLALRTEWSKEIYRAYINFWIYPCEQYACGRDKSFGFFLSGILGSLAAMAWPGNFGIPQRFNTSN